MSPELLFRLDQLVANLGSLFIVAQYEFSTVFIRVRCYLNNQPLIGQIYVRAT